MTDDRCIARVGLIAHELDTAADALRDLTERVTERGPGVVLYCRARPIALRGHLDVEDLLVDLKPRLGGNLGRKFVREAVGIVKRERHAAVEDAASRGLGAVDRIAEECQPLTECRAEALLLAGNDAIDEVLMLDDFRICLAHPGDDLIDEQLQERLLDTE